MCIFKLSESVLSVIRSGLWSTERNVDFLDLVLDFFDTSDCMSADVLSLPFDKAFDNGVNTDPFDIVRW